MRPQVRAPATFDLPTSTDVFQMKYTCAESFNSLGSVVRVEMQLSTIVLVVQFSAWTVACGIGVLLLYTRTSDHAAAPCKSPTRAHVQQK